MPELHRSRSGKARWRRIASGRGGRAAACIGLVVVVGFCGAADAVRAAPAAAADDGIDASAAKSAYAHDCASCHGENLMGRFGPALTGKTFSAKWSAQGESALLQYISQQMPPADPGHLSGQVYAQIAWLLADTNGIAHQQATLAAAQAAASAKAAPTGAEGGGLAAEVQNLDARYQAILSERARRAAAVSSVTERMLREPAAGDWLHWRRTDDGMGFSPLTEINTGNASDLALAWSLTLPSGTNEIAPLVHDGVIFVDSHGTVLAIDAATSDILWKYARPAEAPPYGPPVTNPHGIALFEDRLLVPTMDSHVIALDVHTGKLLWDHVVDNVGQQMRFTADPLVVHGKVILGMSGCAATPGGCFVLALDATSGREVWRFNTIPRPGEPGGDTWNGTRYEDRVGASVWSTATYDPQVNLVFVGTGQTYHIATLMQPDPRRRYANSGLYTDSTLALDPDTGKLIWYYQHMARDVWDFDWPYERIITTLPVHSKPTRVVMTMGKIGILDVLEATSGKYLFSFDLGLQNLVTAIDPKTGWKTTDPAKEPDPAKPVYICPFATGVRNWPPTSYDPTSYRLYVNMGRACEEFRWDRGQPSFDISYGSRPNPDKDGNTGSVAAINLLTRRIEWQKSYRAPEASGDLATAGGLLVEGDRDRNLRVSDSRTGEVLWQVKLDNVPSSVPITFTANGVQYIATTTGGGNPYDVTRRSLTPEIESLPHATTLWLFKLRNSSAHRIDEHG